MPQESSTGDCIRLEPLGRLRQNQNGNVRGTDQGTYDVFKIFNRFLDLHMPKFDPIRDST